MTGDVWGWGQWAGVAPAIPSSTGDSVTAGLDQARRHAGAALDLEQRPWEYFQLLATLGASDLTLARAAEPHLDAVATLSQAGLSPQKVGAAPESAWGVFAARAPGQVLHATHDDGAWRVDGTKPWCSLAGRLDRALVTAEAGDGYRLFAIDLHHPGITLDDSQWQPRGLVDITTPSMTCHAVPAVPVEGPGWYLSRPGFAWGGIGVAAVWFGGAAAVAGLLITAAAKREPDQVALMHLGACDRALTAALATLREAAGQIAQDPRAADRHGALLSLRARSVVAHAAETVLHEVGHATGPAPLAMNPEHTARVADLQLYLRQHHAERDLASLGRQLLDQQ